MAATAPGTVKAIDITIDTSCHAHVGGDQKFNKTYKDIMLLRVKNACDPQSVIICSIPKDAEGPAEPWIADDCFGLKPEMAKPNSPFQINRDAVAHSLCSVQQFPQKRKFCVYVVNKAVGGHPPTCASVTTPCPKDPRVSEIAIEVEP